MGRGSVAAYLADRGLQQHWTDLGNKPGAGQRLAAFLRDPLVEAMPGHLAHRTHQVGVNRYLNEGVLPDTAKVPAYVEQGFPAHFGRHVPVGDAHCSRAMGMADLRDNTRYSVAASAPEMNALQPAFHHWAQQNLGLGGGPTQALMWGFYAPQTGVGANAPPGIPKLEIISRNIMATARRLGITPEEARDRYLRNELPIIRDPK